jgi:ATP-dependent Lhr-like helicase
MKSADGGTDVLDGFDPLIARWFKESLGAPSDIQRLAWGELPSGRHILACAPTGSGKTFAAFLGALDALAVGTYPSGELSVLYLSPLKALNSDIRRNLLEPISALRSLFEAEGRQFPSVSVAVRSGDTTAEERRALQRNPPEILATTPESLALLLNSPRGRGILTRIRLVVLDEIHALIPEKRGAFLSLQLERLALLCGDYRRIALSATVADPAAAAAFVAGYGPEGLPRPLAVVRSEEVKRIDLSLRYPPPLPNLSGGEADPESVTRWAALTDAFIGELARNRTTLIFVNSRRHAEKIAFLINERAGEELAWAHHGSLSREVRSSIEDRLKRGVLKAVVATGSLELGIDIGSVDQVILAGTPGGAAVTMQRLGRAGHRLGQESRAVLFPLHPFDLLLGAAVAADVRGRRLERTDPPRAPLDVLAQGILSMTAMDDWTADELFAVVRRAAPYASLGREDFDLVLEMLRGRFEASRLAALAPRLDRSAPPGVLRAKSSALPLLYGSGGVIPDRGSFKLVLADTRAPLGELDEEFVWERRIGDGFSLGTRAWRIVGIDDRSVVVKPSDRGIQIVPFWRAENLWRGADTMRSVLEVLDRYEAEGEIDASLGLNEESRTVLRDYLERQRLSCPLPLTDRVVSEDFPGPGGQGRYAFLHTLRGGRVNAALGIALRSAAERRYGPDTVEFFWDDAGILASFSAAEDLALRGAAAFPALFEELSGDFSGHLSRNLESTGLFGAAFRENAGRALLLPRGAFGKRMPLWMTRLRSKRLYEAVRGFPDFPIVRETWRTCLSDILDPRGAADLVEGIAKGSLELSFHESAAPSSFARGSLWIASDSFMYRRDEGGGESASDDELIRGLLVGTEKAPQVSAAAVSAVLDRVKRLHPDYRPRDAAELADWLDERRVVSEGEWLILLDGCAAAADLPAAVARLLPGASVPLVLSPDIPQPQSGEFDVASLVAAWMRYEGPASEEAAAALFGPAGVEALRELSDDRSAVRIRVDVGESLYCDAELAARLIRASRTAGRSAADNAELAPGDFQSLVATLQGVVPGGAGTAPAEAERAVEELKSAMDPLLGFSAPLDLWEREILPARTAYLPFQLDLLMDRFPLVWYGAGERRVGFSLEGELRYSDAPSTDPEAQRAAAELLDRARSARFLWSDSDRALLADLVRNGVLTSHRFASAKRVFARLEEPRAAPPPELPYGAPRPKGAFPSRDRWERARLGGPSAAQDRWRLLERQDQEDALDREEILRERARRLLRRYGILFRSLAALDESAPPWPALFRALRMMEFSGETVGGRFVRGVEELQFRFAAVAEGNVNGDAGPFCLCARDPASLCGLAALAAVFDLPSRLAANHVVWNRGLPVLISRRNGRELDFRLPPEDTDASSAVDLLRARLSRRSVDQISPLTVEIVNGVEVRRSPYAPLLRSLGFVESLKGLSCFAPTS